MKCLLIRFKELFQGKNNPVCARFLSPGSSSGIFPPEISVGIFSRNYSKSPLVILQKHIEGILQLFHPYLYMEFQCILK